MNRNRIEPWSEPYVRGVKHGAFVGMVLMLMQMIGFLIFLFVEGIL